MSTETPKEPISWTFRNEGEQRVITTLLSEKPKRQALLFVMFFFVPCVVLSVFSWRYQDVYLFLAASGKTVFSQGKWYQLFTSLFLHGDPGHLISNSYMLIALNIFIFGQLARSIKEGLLLTGFFFLGGAYVNYLILSSYPAEVRLIGISGMVYLAAGFWFVNYLMIDRRRTFKARLLRTTGVALIILFPTTFESTTSYMAHVHGLWVGLTMGAIFFAVNKSFIRSYEVVYSELVEEEILWSDESDELKSLF